MEQSNVARNMARQFTLALLFMLMSGCTMFQPDPVPEPVVEVAEPEPEPAVQPAEPEPRPQPKPAPAPPVPTTFAPRVAVVITGRQPAYENVALELAEVLEDYSLYDLSDRSLSVRQVFERIEAEDATAVVAVGLRAAQVARNLSKVPVVFCQVFNIGENNLVSDQRKGIAAIPPIELQLKAWLELDPGLKNVGAILGSGHDDLIDEATVAANSLEINLHHRVVGSDRETLYVFNRLVPDIDGYLLFPDNRVLSRNVLTEMLNYAARHQVQVAVFNESLLPLGATFSGSAVESDIASSVVIVLDTFARGHSGDLADVTPLTEIEIRTNEAMVRRLGLAGSGSDPDDAVAAGAL